MVNLSSFIRFHALRTPEREALLYAGQRISYADFHDRILRMAAFLQSKGIREGDVVAVFMKNSAAFLEIAYATSHLGAVFLPINFRLARSECEYIVGDAGARLVFADDEYAAIAAGLPNAVIVDAAAQRDGRTLAGRNLPLPEIRPRTTQDLFRLMYTSGTTDRPKGVIHTYENFYWKSMDHVIALGLSANERLLTVGPLYHVGAFDLPGLAVQWVGGTLIVQRDFDPAAVLAEIERERITGAWLAPVMVGRLLACEERDRFDLSSFRWTIAGGEKTPEGRIPAFAKLFPNGRYIDGYGLTESCSGDTLMEPGMEIAKIGSTGRALAHVDVRIRENGEFLPPRTEGEICLRGPKITQGYWNDTEKTARSFENGWFHTGDVGYMDEDGFLYITDRKKDMIISGGENIASSEVERVLHLLSEIEDAAVVGVADTQWGERPVAVVVIRAGAAFDPDALREHCRRHLAAFKVPSRFVQRDVLPRNPSGKLLKRVLRDEFAVTAAGTTGGTK
jgi:fatty-acyl-CoA synthase